jgi:type III pantothenate kinase
VIAVDVGNSRVKWGLFVTGRLVQIASLPLRDESEYDRQLAEWQASEGAVDWSVASVNLDGSDRLLAWLRARGFSSPCLLNDPAMLPLRIELERAESVGVDRLLNAVAVNARRPAGRPAVIVDAGSAVTVDAISSEGSFAGGTIAMGLGLAARGLHELTYFLPLVSITEAPEPIGRSTVEAIQSGLFWGTTGAIKELISRIAQSIGGDAIVYLTGGDGELLAPYLRRPIEVVRDLTLHGIYLTFQHVRSRSPS